MSNVIIRDDKGREIVKINDNGRIAIARFPDLSPITREYVLALYREVTAEDPKELINFLDYKSEENEFCV